MRKISSNPVGGGALDAPFVQRKFVATDMSDHLATRGCEFAPQTSRGAAPYRFADGGNVCGDSLRGRPMVAPTGSRVRSRCLAVPMPRPLGEVAPKATERAIAPSAHIIYRLGGNIFATNETPPRRIFGAGARLRQAIGSPQGLRLGRCIAIKARLPQRLRLGYCVAIKARLPQRLRPFGRSAPRCRPRGRRWRRRWCTWRACRCPIPRSRRPAPAGRRRAG